MKTFIYIIMLVSLAGCSFWKFRPAHSLQDNITYFKDEAGLCYVILKNYTGDGEHIINSITYVPCEKIPQNLLKKDDE